MHARHCQRIGTPPSATRCLAASFSSSAGGVHPRDTSHAAVFSPTRNSTSATTSTESSNSFGIRALVLPSPLLCQLSNNHALSVASGVAPCRSLVEHHCSALSTCRQPHLPPAGPEIGRAP